MVEGVLFSGVSFMSAGGLHELHEWSGFVWGYAHYRGGLGWEVGDELHEWVGLYGLHGLFELFEFE